MLQVTLPTCIASDQPPTQSARIAWHSLLSPLCAVDGEEDDPLLREIRSCELVLRDRNSMMVVPGKDFRKVRAGGRHAAPQPLQRIARRLCKSVVGM